jgi:hypothetical protein
LSSHPFKPRWYLYPLYPLAVAIFLVLRVFGKPFTAMKHRLNKMRLHVRVIPAWGVQYFMKVCEPRTPICMAAALAFASVGSRRSDGCRWRANQSEHERINNHIRAAILEGEAAGAKVVGLGALNKAESLNAGGSIFVKEMPHLKTRVVATPSPQL